MHIKYDLHIHKCTTFQSAIFQFVIKHDYYPMLGTKQKVFQNPKQIILRPSQNIFHTFYCEFRCKERETERQVKTIFE